LTPKERKVTFAEVANRWCQRKSEHKPRTKQRRDEVLRKYLLPAIGHRPIRAIDVADLHDLVSDLKQLGLAPLTVRNIMAIARPIFKQAVIEGLISSNPASGLELSSQPRRTGRALEPEECRLLLEKVDDHHRRVFYTFLATGLRAGEMTQLRIRDIDLKKRVMIVTDSKTKTGQREIDLGENDISVLKEQIVSLGERGLDPEECVFQSVRGRPLNQRNINERVLRKIIRENRLKSFTLHDLRRTHATMLVADGHDPKVVQERMGHKDIETTLKYYAHAAKAKKLLATGAIIRFLGQNDQQLASSGSGTR
jgi:integrase